MSHSPIDPTPRLRLLIAMGTRPEIIKLAPVIWAARSNPAVETIVCHSGQHTDLAEPMLEYFDVFPDLQLDLMRSHSTLTGLIGACISRMAEAFAEHRPDAVIVQGDTATAGAIALAGFTAKIPVVHVEAGLRTGDLTSPWPEEFNRRLATLSASLHCAPTEFAASKLIAEGVPREAIEVTGNPVVDALHRTLSQLPDHASEKSAPRVVLTAHRRENFGPPLENICAAVLELADQFPYHEFHFITHPNPQAGPVVRSILEGRSAVRVVPPLSYPQFIELMFGAKLLISDSGGIQEEAPTLGVPLLVTRESTERPEVVHCGAAELVGTDRARIVQRASEILRLRESERPVRTNPFGDGHAGERIIAAVLARFGGAASHD